MKTINAVAYYRMSTDKQENSIEDQRREVRAYAAKNGYSVIREYKDEGVSGDATEKRFGFQKMIKDATDKADFDVVLCWDQDRFGRFDPLEAGYWIRPLRQAGIRLETIAQGKTDWTDFGGRIIYAVQQEGKHSFLRDLSRNVVRSMLEKAKQGFWLGGPAPYGYQVKDNRLVPGDPREVATVRWLFETYATTDTSLGELARTLNTKGIPSPAGKLWIKTAINKLLSRPAYVGDLSWNRRHDGKYHEVKDGAMQPTQGKRKGPRTNPIKDWVVAREVHPALVERSTFYRVHEKLIERRKDTSPKRGHFVFTRLLFCSHCGSPMHGCSNTQIRTKTRNGHPCNPHRYSYRRYICAAYNTHGSAGCNCNTITERQLLSAVVSRIQKDFLSPSNLAKLRAEIKRQLTPKAKSDNRAMTRKQLTDLEAKIAQGAERLMEVPANLVPAFTAKLTELQAKADQLKAQLEGPQTEPESQGDPEAVLAHLQALQRDLAGCDPDQVKELLRQLVTRIDCTFTQEPYGKRHRSVLAKGTIHLRPDLQVNRLAPHALARGIDGVAHRGALKAGGRTIAVLAGGLSRIYPPEHKELAAEVAAAGALLSEATMDQEPLPTMFPARNRIISGLARAVVLVEAAEKSGALITAEHAALQGRPVFAVPGPVDGESSSGTNALIREGAILCRGAKDVLEELDGLAGMQSAPVAPPPALDAIEQRLWEYLASEPRHLDDIATHLGLSVPKLTGMLLGLEMRKIVRRLPGNRYERA